MSSSDGRGDDASGGRGNGNGCKRNSMDIVVMVEAMPVVIEVPSAKGIVIAEG